MKVRENLKHVADRHERITNIEGHMQENIE